MAQCTDSTDNGSTIASELKGKPAAITNASRRKFGVQRTGSSRTNKLLAQGKAAGVKLPSYSASKFSK